MSITDRIKRIDLAEILLVISLFFIGIFHEYLSCAVSAVILVMLCVRLAGTGKLKFYRSPILIASAAALLFYALSAFWAVDSGAAFIGFMKFLPVPLFLLLLMQQKETDGIIHRLPYVAAVMTVLSAAGMQIPLFRPFFSVAGRLAGFFQYPNTFALFLLIVVLVVLSKDKYSAADFAILALLLFGIVYTGCRTVAVMTVIFCPVMLLSGKNRRVKLAVLGGFVLICAAFVAFLLISGNTGVLSRILTVSLSESTFVGRFLYFRDALPVIATHPFGLGYMGWYYIQQSVQTGIYSVRFVHNDILQLMLDVGWIPFILFAAAVFRALRNSKNPFYKKLILTAILMHSCFDFDLQFIAVFFVLMLFSDYTDGKEIFLNPGRSGKKALICISAAAAVLSVYMGTALALSRFGQYGAAHAMYPWNTQNEISMLTGEKDIAAADKAADGIIARNSHVQVAYSAKARYAYSKGDFAQVIKYKDLIFENAPFAYEEYEEYCYMLINGIALYRAAGDTDSAEICRRELLGAKEKLENTEKRLSRLGRMINDQPTLRLPEEIENYISAMEASEQK